MCNSPQHDWLSALKIYLGASVVLHLVWEVVQLPLYTIWRAGTANEIAFAVVHCTAGDLMIATLSLVTALLIFGTRAWPSERFLPVAACALVAGIGYTAYSEWLNTVVRKSWSYTEFMPTLPGTGLGLSPLAQWLIVPGLAMLAARSNIGGIHRQKSSDT